MNSASNWLSGQAVRVLALGLQAHQVDDVDHAHAQLGQVLAQQRRGGDRLERRDVAGAGQHDVGLGAVVVARPLPDAEAAGAVRDRLVHRQVVQRRLLAGHDHVDVVARAQAVVGDRQQAVGVGRQVDADDLGLLVDDVVDEPRVLVGEAVVVLAPDVRGEQVVQRRDRPPPRDVARDLQPLRVLVEHRVDDVDERLVAGEQPVAAGQQVALQPALAEVLAEHLHHAAVRARGGRRSGRISASQARSVTSKHGAEPVRGRLVGPEDAEACSGLRRMTSRRNPPSTRVASLDGARRRGHVDRVGAEVRQLQVAREQRRRWRAGWRPSGARRGAPRRRARGAARRRRRRAPRGGRSASRSRAARGARGWWPGSRAAPGASGTTPRPGVRRRPWVPSSPSGCAGRSSARPGGCGLAGAGALLDRGDLVRDLVERGRHQLVHRPRARSPRRTAARSRSPPAARAARARGCARARSGWRSCSR